MNETFILNITVANVVDLWAWTASMTWDPRIIRPIGNPIEGPFLRHVGSTVFLPTVFEESGTLEIMSTLFVSNGASGNGTLATLTFKMTGQAYCSPIDLTNVTLFSSAMDPNLGGAHKTIPVSVRQPSATVSLSTGEGLIADAGEPQTVNEDAQITFNASGTYPVTNGTTFHWVFNDSGPVELEGIAPKYRFNIPGVHEVRLAVVDEHGRRSNATVRINVLDITPPVAAMIIRDDNTKAAIILGQTIKPDQMLSFDAFSGSYDPENGTLQPQGYTWDLGDGTLYQNSDPIVKHSYNDTGTYAVKLTVNDARGNLPGSTSIQIIVSAHDSGTISEMPSLPPAILGILIALTAIVIPASILWLTKSTRVKYSTTEESGRHERERSKKRKRNKNEDAKNDQPAAG
jgi:PKD repeat protein